MPRHPLVVLTFLLGVVALILLAATPVIARTTYPGPGDPGVNMTPEMVAGLFAVLAGMLAGACGLMAALLSRRGPRADIVGCLMVAAAPAIVVLTGLATSAIPRSDAAGSDAARGLALASLILAGLVLLAGLVILAVRPGAHQPQERSAGSVR